MIGWYILKDKIPVPSDLMEAGRWMEDPNNVIIEQTWYGDICVSTIFLGFDHTPMFFKSDKPVLFETMIFGGEYDYDRRRYHTWDEAIIGHNEACEMVVATQN
jgi:hypothetical protein